MAKIKFPEDYQRMMPYLIINNADKFLPFMQTVFGAKEKMTMLRDDKSILHAELTVDEQVIMYSAASEQYPARPGSFFIYVEDADKSFDIALKAGGEQVLALSDQDYGRSGGVMDPCGNNWWITAQK